MDASMCLMADEDLVARFRQGESEAFSHLYTRYRPRVMRTARRIMRDPEEAQDATQEIFLKLYRSLHSWDCGKARLSTWLYRMATNHAIDCWRLQRRRPQDQHLEDGSFRSPSPGPHAILEQRERLREVLRYTRGLPRRQRRLFLKRYLADLTLAEIARTEGCKLGTVKGLLHRARAEMHRRLTVHASSAQKLNVRRLR